MNEDNYIPETRGPSECEEQRVQHIEKFGWRRTLVESLAAAERDRAAAMKATKQAVTVLKTDGNSSTVEAQVYDGLLALWRFSKAFALRPAALDFQVSYVPDGMVVGYFKKQATAKAYIAHLLAYHTSDLGLPKAERGRVLHPVWQEFYRRDFPLFPIPEEK